MLHGIMSEQEYCLYLRENISERMNSFTCVPINLCHWCLNLRNHIQCILSNQKIFVTHVIKKTYFHIFLNICKMLKLIGRTQTVKTVSLLNRAVYKYSC